MVLAMVSLWETPWVRGLRLCGASEPDLLIFTRLGRQGIRRAELRGPRRRAGSATPLASEDTKAQREGSGWPDLGPDLFRSFPTSSPPLGPFGPGPRHSQARAGVTNSVLDSESEGLSSVPMPSPYPTF